MDSVERWEANTSWILVLLLICLAAALSFVTFGLGAVNLAGARLDLAQGEAQP